MRLYKFIGLFIFFLFAIRAAGDVVINEIQYNPSNNPEGEFIELVNTGETSVDLTAWELKEAVSYKFPPQSIIPPSSFIIVAKDEKYFLETYPGVNSTIVYGNYIALLNNDGERLLLVMPDGTVHDEVKYNDAYPWNKDADGSGRSLECIDPLSPNDDYKNWQASGFEPEFAQGTPGGDNSVRQHAVPPFLLEVSHTPLVPVENETVHVYATIEGNPESEVTLYYQAERHVYHSPDPRFIAVEMKSMGGDTATERYYAGRITGQSSHTLVRYYIEAKGKNNAISRFPPEAPRFGRGWFVQDSTRFNQPDQDMLIADPFELQNIQDNAFNESLFTVGSYVCDGELFDNAIIHLRGVSARFFPKKNFKVRLPKSHCLPRGQHIVNLNCDYHDASHICNALSMELYEQLGMSVPRIEFIRLDINNEYAGVYYRIEQINERWLKNNERDADGDLYQCNHYHIAPPNDAYYPLLYERRSGDDNDFLSIASFIQALTRELPESCGPILSSSFEMDTLINYLVGRTLISHADDWHKNHYLYLNTEKNGGKWEIFPWDDDLTWGHNNSIENGLLNTDFTTTQPAFFNIKLNPLFCAVRDNPIFRRAFDTQLALALETVFTEEYWNERIDYLHSLIADAVHDDPYRWESFETFLAMRQQLKDYVKLRREFLLQSVLQPTAAKTWQMYE